MPMGKGTYGSKVGRPEEKKKKKSYRGGGRTAADTAKTKAAHSRSSHKYFAGASQNPKRVGRMNTGGKVTKPN